MIELLPDPRHSLLEVLQPTWTPMISNARVVQGMPVAYDELPPVTGRPKGSKDKQKRKAKA